MSAQIIPFPVKRDRWADTRESAWALVRQVYPDWPEPQQAAMVERNVEVFKRLAADYAGTAA